MQTIEIVNSVIKKDLVLNLEQVRTGPKGYGLVLIFRLLLYSVLAEVWSTRFLLKHLKKKPKIWRKLGFHRVPGRRTVDGWFQKYDKQLEQFVEIVGDEYLQLSDSVWTLIDSTPIPDENDPDARKGHTSKGEFKGFKLHMSCDEKRVPLRATFTTGNVHDVTQAPKIITPTFFVGADAGYDSKELKTLIWSQPSVALIVHNPRWQGKENKRPSLEILKKFRVCIEQCNSIVKIQVLKELWTNIKGFAKKATRCFLGVLALQALAIYNIKKRGYPSLKISEVRA